MRTAALSTALILMAIYFIFTVATEVFVDDYIQPDSLFTYLLAGTVLTTLASLAVNIEIPK